MSINPEFLPCEAKPVDAIGQALLNAANKIRLQGHWKGGPRGPNGERCVIGALDIEYSHVARTRLLNYLGKSCITTWNDAPERTAEQVIAALEAAALATP